MGGFNYISNENDSSRSPSFPMLLNKAGRTNLPSFVTSTHALSSAYITFLLNLYKLDKET